MYKLQKINGKWVERKLLKNFIKRSIRYTISKLLLKFLWILADDSIRTSDNINHLYSTSDQKGLSLDAITNYADVYEFHFYKNSNDKTYKEIMKWLNEN